MKCIEVKVLTPTAQKMNVSSFAHPTGHCLIQGKYERHTRIWQQPLSNVFFFDVVQSTQRLSF